MLQEGGHALRFAQHLCRPNTSGVLGQPRHSSQSPSTRSYYFSAENPALACRVTESLEWQTRPYMIGCPPHLLSPSLLTFYPAQLVFSS
jgi:hypothetical protein